MSSTLKIKLLDESLEVSFDVGDTATDICAGLSMKDYPIGPENFKVTRDNEPWDKWIPLNPMDRYTFYPADPIQTSSPKKHVTADESRQEKKNIVPPTPHNSGGKCLTETTVVHGMPLYTLPRIPLQSARLWCDYQEALEPFVSE